jgi:hypothetical protein
MVTEEIDEKLNQEHDPFSLLLGVCELSAYLQVLPNEDLYLLH